MIVVFFGPPGVGKGTQCALLAERKGFVHVSTGAIIRSEIASGSVIGQKVKEVVAAGKLVDDELLFECFRSYLKPRLNAANSILLDGVPRTVAQVDKLDEVLSSFGGKVSHVIALVADVERLIERFAKRWTCTCGHVTAFNSEIEAKAATCTKCGAVGKFYRRDDDKEEVVRQRMVVFQKETAPVLEVYRARGILKEINGLDTVENVYQQIIAALQTN